MDILFHLLSVQFVKKGGLFIIGFSFFAYNGPPLNKPSGMLHLYYFKSNDRIFSEWDFLFLHTIYTTLKELF